LFESFLAQSKETLNQMFGRGQYIGWWAGARDQAGKIGSRAGAQLREASPHPQPDAHRKTDCASRRQAISQNVHTPPAARRQGPGALLMKEIISWSRKTGIDSLVLHASDEGRALYEKLGFIPTTEMRLRRGQFGSD